MQDRFLKDKSSLLETILLQGNPFDATQKDIVNIYTHEKALNSSLIYKLEEKATELFEDYLEK